eukprot:366000-Chlamydomonas_euryale.AAC.76
MRRAAVSGACAANLHPAADTANAGPEIVRGKFESIYRRLMTRGLASGAACCQLRRAGTFCAQMVPRGTRPPVHASKVTNKQIESSHPLHRLLSHAVPNSFQARWLPMVGDRLPFHRSPLLLARVTPATFPFLFPAYGLWDDPA